MLCCRGIGVVVWERGWCRSGCGVGCPWVKSLLPGVGSSRFCWRFGLCGLCMISRRGAVGVGVAAWQPGLCGGGLLRCGGVDADAWERGRRRSRCRVGCPWVGSLLPGVNSSRPGWRFGLGGVGVFRRPGAGVAGLEGGLCCAGGGVDRPWVRASPTGSASLVPVSMPPGSR